MISNPLISLQGFDYLLEQIKNERCSKTALIGLRDALYQEQISKPPEEAFEERKHIQIRTLLHILKTISFTGNILEIGCGNGQLSKILAEAYTSEITALDSNQELIEKNKRKNKQSRISYITADAFQYQPDKEFGIVIGLHCCGSLTDRLIDLTIKTHARLLCFPCCYGKISQSNIELPRSQLLKGRKKQFHYTLKRAGFLEGYVDERETAKPNVFLELYRRMIDFDRIFYLRENNYKPYFIRANTRGFNSSLRSSIIA